MHVEIKKRNPSDRVLDLGGGGNRHPVADVCVDIRPAPDVDFTWDLTQFPWPIADADFDLVHAAYVLEHMPYAVVPAFLAEVFRVLRPGGHAVFVLPDTAAQLMWIWDHPAGWDGKDPFVAASELLYGSQNMPGPDGADANTHKAYFSPDRAQDLFGAAGFDHIEVHPYNERRTDMVVVARKPLTSHVHIAASGGFTHAAVAQMPQEQRAPTPEDGAGAGEGQVSAPTASTSPLQPPAELFDKHYFNGGGKVGGYAREGYWDYPTHEVTARHILDRKPESVLELGCARGYVLKRLEDVIGQNGSAGHCVMGVEVSKHCYLTRVCNCIKQMDLCETPWDIGFGKDGYWKIPPNKFDLCYSVATLEHVPEDKLPAVIAEMARTCRRGLHGVDFGHNDDGFDKTHCFPAGTLVDMADGSRRPVERVTADDAVVGESGGRSTVAKVRRTYRRWAKELIQLTLKSGGTLVGTANHPVMTPAGWVKLGDITAGDSVYEIDREAGEIRPEVLPAEDVQGNRGGPGSILALAPALRRVETGAPPRSLGAEQLDGGGERNPARLLRVLPAGGDTEEVAAAGLGINHARRAADGACPFPDSRVRGTAAVPVHVPGGSGLRRGDHRRGRLRVSAEGKELSAGQAQEVERLGEAATGAAGDAPGLWGNGLQLRPEDDRFHQEPVRRGSNDPRPADGRELQSPVLRAPVQRAEDTPPAPGGLPVHDHQAGGGRRSHALPGTSSVQGEERPHRAGGVDVVFRVAEVMSAQRLTGVEVEVFNLETSTQNYVAGGVLVHNCTLRPREWWLEQFARHAPGWPVEVVDKEFLESTRAFPEGDAAFWDGVRRGDGKVKLNIGSHTTMFHRGWTNIDVGDLAGFAGHYGYHYLRHDVRGGLPFNTGTVDLIVLSHSLEHFTMAEGLTLLRECRRVLKPDGAMRVIVPDAELLVRLYYAERTGKVNAAFHVDGLTDFDEVNDGCAASPTAAGKLWSLLVPGHQAAYDAETLCWYLNEAGFDHRVCGFRQGQQQILRETLDVLPCLSLYAEGIPRLAQTPLT